MINEIELCEANPIPLAKVKEELVWYSKEYYQSCYCQKFRPSDKTALQLLADTPLSADVYLVNRHGRRIGSVDASFPSSGIDGVYLCELRPNFASLSFSSNEPPVCYIKGTIKRRGFFYPIQSQPLLIGDVPESVYLEYSSLENTNSIVFTTGIKFGLRIEGGFIPKAYSPAADDTIYKDEQVDFMLLKSTPYDTFSFTAGRLSGIPDWLHAIINRAFSCDTLLADNVQIVKVDGAEWENDDVDGYDLREWRIDVAKAKNTGTYQLGRSSAEVYWSDYLCQLQSTPLAYVFEFTENQGTALEKEAQNVGGAVRIGITSLRAELPYGSITVNNLPAWATLTREGADFLLTVGANPTDARIQAITFVQGESGKAITLQLIQRGTETYDPYVATVDDGATTAVIGGNTYLSAT
jgi:hypothetical protein